MRSERFTDAQVGVIEFSFNKLPDTSALDRESQLMNELNSNLLTDPDEIIYPGVTLSRVWEVMQSPEFIAYSILCQPEKRIGVSQADIDLAIHAYRVTFPDCVEHFPLWVE